MVGVFVQVNADALRPVGYIQDAGGCWIWVSSRSTNGYGLCWNGRRNVRAHRLMYERAKGPIPTGWEVDHLCRVPLCVNPHHLEAVPPEENNRRSSSPTAINGRKTHCHKGHALTPDNLVKDRLMRLGHRICKTCLRAWEREWRKRRASRPFV